MSFELLLDKESLGRVATNSGYADMAEYAREHGGDECKALFDSGESKDVATLCEELSELRDRDDVESDVAATIDVMLEMLDGQTGVVSATSELVMD